MSVASRPTQPPAGGPAVVAVGGGHGLAVTLRAVRRYAGRLTAIVAVADDGGSSGKLRDSMAIPAPGDLRRCLSALAPPGSLLGGALGHRFHGGDLDGHALGNLLLAGLADAGGDFVAAVDELSRLVGLGSADVAPQAWPARLLPAATEAVVLGAETVDGAVCGQVAVKGAAGIRRLTFDPPTPCVTAEAVAAIAAAEQIVLGPGSLFTSVLAAAAVPGVRDALAATDAPAVYVCNLGPERRETEGFTVADHVAALHRHGVVVDRVLCQPGAMAPGVLEVAVVERPVARADGRGHDPVLLSLALTDLV
ncbi:hypothetical protein BH20ACT2_BH20ACT2_22190 [soil metagenome]